MVIVVQLDKEKVSNNSRWNGTTNKLWKHSRNRRAGVGTEPYRLLDKKKGGARGQGFIVSWGTTACCIRWFVSPTFGLSSK